MNQIATQKVEITRLDPALDAIVPADAELERLATGHDFTEGPIYMREGYLLYSDIPRNTIYKWTPDGQVSEFMKPSGYEGTDAPPGAFIGSNGLTVDGEGRLVICEHGNGRVTRLERDGKKTVLAAKYEGRRLNSPNDIVFKSDGSIYFSDPPYGFVQQDEDPKKELDYNGIFRLADGKLQLLTKELTRPNGLAFSPDEKYLYVSNSDPKRKIWVRYEVQTDGGIRNGQTFLDVTGPEAGNPDGLKIDKQGNLYCTGPAGVYVITPELRHIGTIGLPEVPANCHWGKYTDGKASAELKAGEGATALYITAQSSVYRVVLNIAGIRP